MDLQRARCPAVAGVDLLALSRKASNDSFVSVVRWVGEINKSLLGIASEMTEQRAFEMQAQLAKKAYETDISEITN
jgi:hypothetical protein